MKYKPEIYAKAFLEAQKASPGKQEEMSKRFLETVRKNGDFRSAGKILKVLGALLTGEHGGRVRSVESALDLQDGTREKFSERFQKDDLVEFSINPTLIAGARVTVNNSRELDFSFKRKLNKLFK